MNNCYRSYSYIERQSLTWQEKVRYTYLSMQRKVGVGFMIKFARTKPDTLQGSLNMLVLKTLKAETLHGYAIAQRIGFASDELLRVEEGSLYPALHRMESLGWISSEWKLSESNRRARFYTITKAGRKQLQNEQASWERLIRGVDLVLQA